MVRQIYLKIYKQKKKSVLFRNSLKSFFLGEYIKEIRKYF